MGGKDFAALTAERRVRSYSEEKICDSWKVNGYIEKFLEEGLQADDHHRSVDFSE